MNPPENQLQHKFSLIPRSITQLLLVLVVLLLVSMGFIIQSAVTTQLKGKSYQLTGITQQLHKRIDTYRYVTWQIYDNISVNHDTGGNGLQETRLRPDIYYLKKPRHKTEVLIYGSHDTDTLEMSASISDYLDILWGAKQIPWSMYYLNGQDNSMILVSTLPLKNNTDSFKEPDIHNLMEARRTEMLQHATALDVRESFSGLRFLNWQNAWYFTLHTTFNQPGHLATVVAFDLPLNDMIASDVRLDSLRLSSEPLSVSANSSGNNRPPIDSVHIGFSGSSVEIAAPIASTRLNLVRQVALTTLLTGALQDSMLPLLINIVLLALVLFGYTAFRYPATSQSKTDNGNNALHLLRALNEEIISQLPVGLLVHDTEANRTIFSNKIADYLLPHLDLSNISDLAEQHQGVIQATINNELYEIRLFYSQIAPHIQIFILRDQDKELLVNSKLKQARRLYEKNQLGRIRFMQHLGETLQQPFTRMVEQLSSLPEPHNDKLNEAAQAIIEIIEAIQLLSQLDSSRWQKSHEPFVVQQVLDDLVVELLPLLKRKGLQLLVDNTLAQGDVRLGDPHALNTILNMLVHYAVITTELGCVTLKITGEGDKLSFCLLDTGKGLQREEIENLYFPYLNDTSADEYGKASGMTFYLCNQLTEKFGGQLTIESQPELGTCYNFSLHFAPQVSEEQQNEQLLDGMVAMVDVSASAVRELVKRRLTQWGAVCVTPDEKLSRQAYDIFFTDNPANLTVSGILLSDNISGVQHAGAGKWRVNFNISRAMYEAVLQLIEEQLAMEEIPSNAKNPDETSGSLASGYYPLFAETVPVDIQKLYTGLGACDFTAMAQTAHRLKGVFAMLNLVPGKQLCETLEHHIREKDVLAIKQDIGDTDIYVKRLLSQGSLNE